MKHVPTTNAHQTCCTRDARSYPVGCIGLCKHVCREPGLAHHHPVRCCTGGSSKRRMLSHPSRNIAGGLRGASEAAQSNFVSAQQSTIRSPAGHSAAPAPAPKPFGTASARKSFGSPPTRAPVASGMAQLEEKSAVAGIQSKSAMPVRPGHIQAEFGGWCILLCSTLAVSSSHFGIRLVLVIQPCSRMVPYSHRAVCTCICSDHAPKHASDAALRAL